MYPKFLEILGSLNEQLSALKSVQTENGLWRTILDDPDSYEELSASAGIAAAMLANRNPLHIKYINKTLHGFKQNISEDGRVLNVSGGTAVMRDREGYRTIEIVPDDWHARFSCTGRAYVYRIVNRRAPLRHCMITVFKQLAGKFDRH